MRRRVQDERQQSPGQKCSPARTFPGECHKSFAEQEAVRVSKVYLHRSRPLWSEPSLRPLAPCYLYVDAERAWRALEAWRERNQRLPGSCLGLWIFFVFFHFPPSVIYWRFTNAHDDFSWQKVGLQHNFFWQKLEETRPKASLNESHSKSLKLMGMHSMWLFASHVVLPNEYEKCLLDILVNWMFTHIKQN